MRHPPGDFSGSGAPTATLNSSQRKDVNLEVTEGKAKDAGSGVFLDKGSHGYDGVPLLSLICTVHGKPSPKSQLHK